MRLKAIAGTGVVAVVGFLAVPAASATVVGITPQLVPPGAQIEVKVVDCPLPQTVQARASLSPKAGAEAAFNVGAVDSSGSATLVVRLPIDASPGAWTATGSCHDAAGASVGTPATADFSVAQLSQLTVQPKTLRAGTNVTVTVTACPTNTDSAFANTVGASDSPTPLFDLTHPGTRLSRVTGLTFRGVLAVPANAPVGENLVFVYCVGEGGSPLAGPFHGVFIVDNSLPATGVDIGTPILFGATALVVGPLLILVARRRPSSVQP